MVGSRARAGPNAARAGDRSNLREKPLRGRERGRIPPCSRRVPGITIIFDESDQKPEQGHDNTVNTGRIKLLGISGSPRVGATDFAVRAALDYAREKYQVETDYFTARGKKIGFCIHCDHCLRKREGCIQKDDVQDLYPKLEWANAWLLGSPVYQGQICGQLKAMLDRCRALVAKNPKIFRNRVGAGIAVGGDRNGGQEPTIQTLIDFYLINEMIPVGGGSFGANLGGAVWSRDKGAEGAGEDAEGIKAIRRTVDRLIEVASLIHQ